MFNHHDNDNNDDATTNNDNTNNVVQGRAGLGLRPCPQEISQT